MVVADKSDVAVVVTLSLSLSRSDRCAFVGPPSKTNPILLVLLSLRRQSVIAFVVDVSTKRQKSIRGIVLPLCDI